MEEKKPDIPDLLPVTEILLQLAEECNELAQACHKVRRCMDDLNPCRMTYQEAVTKLNEEWADVLLSKRYVNLFNDEFVYEVMRYKHDRWLNSLTEQKDGAEVIKSESQRHDD